MAKKRKRRFKTVDWINLQSGDTIKIIRGYGPYMLVGDKKYNIGVPGGRYQVKKLSEDGIHAYQGISHFFIYMGPKKPSAVGFSAPHKFKKCLIN